MQDDRTGEAPDIIAVHAGDVSCRAPSPYRWFRSVVLGVWRLHGGTFVAIRILKVRQRERIRSIYQFAVAT